MDRLLITRLSDGRLVMLRKSQLGFGFHLEGGMGSSHRGAHKAPGLRMATGQPQPQSPKSKQDPASSNAGSKDKESKPAAIPAVVERFTADLARDIERVERNKSRSYGQSRSAVNRGTLGKKHGLTPYETDNWLDVVVGKARLSALGAEPKDIPGIVRAVVKEALKAHVPESWRERPVEPSGLFAEAAGVQKSLVHGHYRKVGARRVYIRPHVACEHPSHRIDHIHVSRNGGRPKRVRVCTRCGRIWGTRVAKSLGSVSKAVALEPGQRWITVHPNGEDEKGIPVLIQEHPDGSASIIRGAGGKLNYLRLTKLRKPEEWKQARKELQEEKAKRKERVESLSAEERAREEEFRSGLKTKKKMKDAEYVSAVMQAHGIKDEEWKLPEKVLSNLPAKSRDLAESQHLRKMVKMADEMVAQARQDIMAAQDEVIKEAVGDLPGLTVLPPEPVTGQGKGYVAAVQKKAAENGLTAAQARTEKQDISWRHFLDAADGNEADALAKKEMVERLHEALAAVRSPVTQARKAGLLDVELKPKQPDVKDIAKVLLAEKQHREVERQVRQVTQETNEAGLPKTAFVTATEGKEPSGKDLAEAAISEMSSADAKDALAQELQEDAMQRAAAKLLSEADAESGRGELKEHIGVGHYDALNTAALGVTKAPATVDRLTADILGPAASAQLMVEGWRRQFSPSELEVVRTAVANYHINRQKAVAEEASREYEDLKGKMEAINVPNVTDSNSLMQAQVANDQRAELLMQARRTLGTALGKLEGYAALVEAFEEGSPQELKVSLGAISNADAVAQARVLGLSSGFGDEADYVIDSDGVNKFLTVKPAGIEKLIRGYDEEFARKARLAEEIKSGAQDEDGWLPEGIVARPATTFDDPHERALMVTEPLRLEEGMSAKDTESAVEDYIGARLADGQDPESLRSDMLSAEFVAETVPKSLVGEHCDGAYYKALKNLGFFSYKQVENLSGEELAKRAEEIVAKRRAKLGESANIAALNSQSIPLGETTYEAAHRAMAKVPQAQVISKGLGELTPQDKGTLRDYFWKNLTDEKPPVAAETRERRKEAEARAEEVVGYQHNIFGGLDEVKRGPAEGAEEGPKETAWDRYVRAMGGTDRAYAAIQDLAKGEFMSEFAKELGRITGTEFKTGTKRIAHWDRHVLGLLSPEKQTQLLGERESAEKRRQAQVAARSGGKFAREEKAGDRKARAEELMRVMKQKQMKLFKAGREPAIERATLGERAEAQLAKVFPMVARNFDPKKPVEIPHDVSMSGKFVMQQRSVKMLEAMKRIGLHLGVGSGKSLIALGGFAHLHSQGKVKRAIFAVPSIVQAQMGREALRYLQPGKYRWFANPAASAEERRAAYADPGRHIVVVTHQALRDDLTDLLAKQRFGGDTGKASHWLEHSTEAERKSGIKEAMDKAGWKFDMSVLDEGHDLLNRRGKKNSRMANAIDALTFNTPYHLSMTADPIKNDASEAHDMLHKLDPERYSDPDAFHRKYGVDTAAAQMGLQHELQPYTITGRIRPEVSAPRIVRSHDLTPEQSSQYRDVLANYRKARNAARSGKVDVDAVRAMSPHTFRGLTDEQARTKAKELSQFLASTRDMALQRVIDNGHVDPDVKTARCAKLDNLIETIGNQKRPDGTQAPGIVFAHSRAAVKRIKAEVAKRGLKVLTLTGEDSGADKEKAKLGFQGGGADVIVMSDAGSVGANLQRAQYVVQYDTPDTAKTHEQRIGRMERIGQINPNIVAIDLVSNTPHEAARRKRLARKNVLREVFTSPTEMTDDTGLAHEIWKARQAQLQRDILPQAAG